MPNYYLEDLDPSKFEELVVAICNEILGIGVISFAKGKDGGKDAKFEGKAQKYPSSKDPWSGKFVIQAKHTSNPIASCSDSHFKNILKKEIKKIKSLVDKNEINNYLLFTNRKYTAVNGEKLLYQIKDETVLNNVVILGKETLNRYLDSNKGIVKQFSLGLPDLFNFNDEEIKKVLIELKKHLPTNKKDIKVAIEKVKYDFYHIEKKQKNQKNELGQEYYEQSMLGESLKYFTDIKDFLANPINEEFKEYYEGNCT